MNILVFSTFQGPHHLETEMEIIDDHLNSNDSVEILTCRGALRKSGCLGNPEKLLSVCQTCISRHNNAFKELNLKSENIKVLNLPKNQIKKYDFNHLEELNQLNLNGFDVGSAVSSSLVFYKKNSRIETSKFSDEISLYINTAMGLYNYFIEYFKNNKVDLVYFLNGRFLENKPLYRVCQNESINFRSH